jgi:hypothetical protein
MDNALVAALGTEERDVKFSAIALEFREHGLRQGVGEGPGLGVRGHDVVGGSKGSPREADREIEFSEHGEGLGAGDLVYQMGSDEELGLASGQLANSVGSPGLFE